MRVAASRSYVSDALSLCKGPGQGPLPARLRLARGGLWRRRVGLYPVLHDGAGCQRVSLPGSRGEWNSFSEGIRTLGTFGVVRRWCLSLFAQPPPLSHTDSGRHAAIDTRAGRGDPVCPGQWLSRPRHPDLCPVDISERRHHLGRQVSRRGWRRVNTVQ